MQTITAKPRAVKEPRPKKQLAPIELQKQMHAPTNGPGPELRSAMRKGLLRKIALMVYQKFPLNVEDLVSSPRAPGSIALAAGLCWNGANLEDRGSGLRCVGMTGGFDVSNPSGPLGTVSYDELLPEFRNVVADRPDRASTTTPAGMLANDPDAQQVLKSKLSQLASRPRLERNEREFLMELNWAQPLAGKTLDKAEQLVEKYLNGTPAKNRTTEPSIAGSNTPAAAAKVSLKNCERHPHNRVPTPAQIERMAESLQKEGLLERPVLRPVVGGKYQIVSGETRILAMKKLGWHETDAELVHCDDARALELLAVYNAEREDLNPIQTARMIEQLCQPIDKGGSGMTREQAGKIYKLESGSAASNLVRLLELPVKWQNRVSDGELAESFARATLKVSHAPRLMDRLEKSWERHHKAGPGQCEFCAGRRQSGPCWESREWIERIAQALIDDFTRPLKDGSKFQYGYNEMHGKLKDYYHFTGEYPMLFDADEALEAKLEVREFVSDKKPVRRATNVGLYDKLQIPLIKAFVEKRDKKAAEKSGRDRRPGPKREPTAARTRQLSERIAAWRHTWLRRLVAQQIELGNDSGLRVVLAHAADDHLPHGALKFSEALESVRPEKTRKSDWREDYWPLVADVKEALSPTAVPIADQEGEVVAKLAQAILVHESKDHRRPTVPRPFVDSYAADLGIDLKAAWAHLQQGLDPLLEQFFLLHQTEQLRDLAKELGKHVPENATRSGMVKVLLAFAGGRLPLPKCIKLLGGKREKGKQKAAKSAKEKKKPAQGLEDDDEE